MADGLHELTERSEVPVRVPVPVSAAPLTCAAPVAQRALVLDLAAGAANASGGAAAGSALPPPAAEEQAAQPGPLRSSVPGTAQGEPADEHRPPARQGGAVSAPGGLGLAGAKADCATAGGWAGLPVTGAARHPQDAGPQCGAADKGRRRPNEAPGFAAIGWQRNPFCACDFGASDSGRAPGVDGRQRPGLPCLASPGLLRRGQDAARYGAGSHACRGHE